MSKKKLKELKLAMMFLEDEFQKSKEKNKTEAFENILSKMDQKTILRIMAVAGVGSFLARSMFFTAPCLSVSNQFWNNDMTEVKVLGKI